MPARTTGTSWLDRAVPIAYLCLAALVAITVLPTTLRPPPDPSNSSAAFSPDAPPDQQDSIVAALSRGSSATAGGRTEGENQQGEVAGGDPEAARLPGPPSSGRCFGKPPRQTESIYSAPCAPAWVGDNGGSTYKNVSPNEIRIGLWHSNGTPSAGPVSDKPTPGEGAPARTLRVLQAYFNQRFETYGRQIRLYALPGGESPEEARAAVLTGDQEWKLFAVRDIRHESCVEAVRRGMMAFCNPLYRDDHQAAAPLRWSWMMDRTSVDEIGAEYMCKKLVGRTADFTSDPVLQGKPRKFGLVVENSPQRLGKPHVFVENLRKECGAEFASVVEITDRWNSAAIGTGITQMKSDGVTSLVFDANYVVVAQMMAAADAQTYLPEWVLFASSGLDFNAVGQILPPSQMKSVFGLTAWELPQPVERQECTVAYKSIDPTGTPAAATCSVHWPDLLQIMNGIQTAGPNLTPETFRDGLFRIGYRWPAERWGIGGGYAPNDWTYQDNMGEIWWDGSAIAPENDQPGAYRWTNGGHRYRRGEFTTEETTVFREGITTG